MTFFLAMALNPGVQIKAQEELDRVLGPYTLPCATDRPRLPYINAIVKESLRWYPVAPMGLPHLCTEEDEYEGYRIPKGGDCDAEYLVATFLPIPIRNTTRPILRGIGPSRTTPPPTQSPNGSTQRDFSAPPGSLIRQRWCLGSVGGSVLAGCWRIVVSL